MVSQQDSWATILLRTYSEKPVPRVSRRSLHRSIGTLHEALDVSDPDFALQTERRRQALDEFRILRRCPPAQAMVDMTDHQISKARRYQQSKQRHGIRST